MTSESRIGRSALARWALLLALTAGMVLMHHVPGGHGHHSSPASATAPTAVGTGQHQLAHGVPSTAEHGQPSSERPDAERHGPVQLDDLLHLCLAIIAGAALLLLDRQRHRAPLTGANPAPSCPARPRNRRRRPPPMRRRLAELCVLRL